MNSLPIRARRKLATRRFRLRVVVLVALIAGVSYAAWFARWARPANHVAVELSR